MIFRNVFSQIHCICTLAVSFAGLSQDVAYVLLDGSDAAMRGEGRLQSGIMEGVLPVVSTDLQDFKIVVGRSKASRYEDCITFLSFHYFLLYMS